MSLKKEYSKSKSTCKVTFSLPSEAVNGGKKVLVVGTFNDWNVETGVRMKKNKDVYKASLELPIGKDYEFRYLIDQDHWTNDWNADAYVPTPYGVENGVVFLPVVEETVAKVKVAAPKKKAAAPKAKRSTKKSTGKDNLKKIEGIGPKIEKLLQEAGILTFADLSKAPQSTLKDVLKAAGNRFKMHDPTTWPKQAALAAADKWEELATLQDELKGGRL